MAPAKSPAGRPRRRLGGEVLKVGLQVNITSGIEGKSPAGPRRLGGQVLKVGLQVNITSGITSGIEGGSGEPV